MLRVCKLSQNSAVADQVRVILTLETTDVAIIEPLAPSGWSWPNFDSLIEEQVPTIVVTASSDPHVLTHAVNRGAQAVLTQPFVPTELRDTIATIS